MADDLAVRSDVQAFLDELKAHPRPRFSRFFLTLIRFMPTSLMVRSDLPIGDLAVDRKFSMRGTGGKIALRLFDPREHRDTGPVVVFYHGGGFCVGSIGTHAPLCAKIARALDLPVVSVEYRLAPRFPWPAAPDDAEAAARWIAKSGEKLGLDIDGLILCGDSAGGNLALVTAIALRDDPAAKPVVQQIAIYPGTDTLGDYPSVHAFSDGYGLDSDDMELFEEYYAGDADSWRHSPLKSDLAGLAPSVIATASHDPLRDQGRAFAKKLKAAGCEVAYHEAKGTIHGYATFRKAIPSAADDLAAVLALAKAQL
ncbi:alpha/beta hydrolase [Erythrobacter alti]|uniref:alpha/beta hydrolase n=1 Tax=Erythrobacter alti TaxID=1896145 RepID=UPI0030F3C096